MNPHRRQLKTLFALARHARTQPVHVAEAQAAPLGFATRVAARWGGQARRLRPADLWERLAWWGAGAAVAVCVVAMLLPRPEQELTSLDLLLATPPAEQELF
ncbi:MAG: hypothetical protein HYY24_27735 [Verrucomicrobia bacterium]|nr:hypothetical protein [Verrucomicrobiota bacterium]